MDRRSFLKTAGAAGSAALVTGSIEAQEPSHDEFIGCLTDTTRCIGCRACEVACAEAHGLPVPDVINDGALEMERKTSTEQWTVVNRYETDKGTVYAKKQCMHCWQPACAAACLTNAMYKTQEGPVIWRANKCMGCRFCMVSCPFVIPRFEYDSANPKIQKCILCYERLEEGQIPACVETCPVDALQFGTRREMERIAQNRVANHPNDYVDHIYGQHEVGGTGWLYLSAVPFDQIGFRTDLSHEPVPALTQNFLYSVPIVFLLWPAILNGMRYTKSNEDAVQIDMTDNTGEDS